MTILKISLSASILIIAIMTIRKIMLHRLPKKTFLILWCAASLRLLNSLSIPSHFSIYTLFDEFTRKDFGPSHASGATFVMDMANFTTLSGASATALDYKIIFRGIWLIGLTACVFLILTKHFRSLMDYKASLPVDSSCVKLWEKEKRMVRKVEIRQSDKINSALTYGLFHPVILLPKTTDWEDERKLRYILAHEYAHIRRFDIVYKWLFATVLCIHWFNPLVWIMYTLANRDIELACDEAVLQIFGSIARSSYAKMLIELQERKDMPAPLTNFFSKNAIEERTVSIMKAKKMTFVSVTAAFAVVICTVIVFASDPTSSVAEEISVAGQEISLDEGNAADGSADMIDLNNISMITNGSTVHEIKNGHMVIYNDGENSWNLTQGEIVNLQVKIDNVLKDGQTAVIGYVVDNIYTDIFIGKIKENKTVEFTVPDDGEYTFYMIGASSDTMNVQSFEVNRFL